MRPAALLWLCLLAACGGGGPRQQLLSEMPSFAGRVTIDSRVGDSERTLAGELRFDRARGHLEFVRRGEQTVTLVQAGTGQPLQKRVDGELVEPQPDDLAVLQVVWMTVRSEPPDGAAVRREEGSYEIELGDFRLRVDLEPADATPRD